MEDYCCEKCLSIQIFEAVNQRNHKLLRTLLKDVNSSQVNEKYTFNRTPLDLAVLNGDLTATTLLLDHGAVPDYKRRQYEKFANRVYHQSDSIDFKSLLNCNSIPELYRVECRWAPNTLLRAIQAGNRDVIKLLIDRGCDPDMNLELGNCYYSVSYNYYNCWYKIIESKDLPMFEFLVECTGREVGDNQWSQSMFLTACATGSDEIIIYLLDKGVPIDTRNQVFSQTGAYKALLGRHTDIFTELVDRGANLHITDENGLSLMHIAVFLSDWLAFLLLLERGLSIDCRDLHNRTPLHYMAKRCPTALNILIEHGADINAVDNYGYTPIFLALVFNAHESMIRLLFKQKNINFTKQDDEGRTLLHHLITRTDLYLDILIDTLFLPQIDMNIRDKNNMTLLHHAIIIKSFRLIEMLVELGADTGAIRDYRRKLSEGFGVSMKDLARLKLRRKVAGFCSDTNIDDLFSERDLESYFSPSEYQRFLLKFQNTIETMKNTQLLGQLTYFDFLHAKRRACITVAKKPEMRKIFLEGTHNFHYYFYALAKSYIYGLKPLTEEENDAITLVEDNLNVLFKRYMPSTVTYQIKKYIEIEDMVTVQKIVTES